MAAKAKQMLYTQEGFKKLEQELSEFKSRREQVKEDIAVARSFGDLSENAEYDEARNEQAKVEARIKELEDMIANAKIVDESQIDTNVVSLGSFVEVYFIEEDSKHEYSIVGSNEANAFEDKISDQSPIGKALVGKKKGNVIEVETPAGVVHIKVLNVSRNTNND